MLKEVGASGQISLGKKYAGQLFDMQVLEDGRVQLMPVKVVPVAQEELAAYPTGDGGLTPEHALRTGDGPQAFASAGLRRGHGRERGRTGNRHRSPSGCSWPCGLHR